MDGSWNVREMFVKCSWNVHGMFMDGSWNVHGFDIQVFSVFFLVILNGPYSKKKDCSKKTFPFKK